VKASSEKRKRQSTTIDYFISGSANKASSPKSAREIKETTKLELLAANASSMIADSLKVFPPSNLATVKYNEVVEEKNPVVLILP